MRATIECVRLSISSEIFVYMVRSTNYQIDKELSALPIEIFNDQNNFNITSSREGGPPHDGSPKDEFPADNLGSDSNEASVISGRIEFLSKCSVPSSGHIIEDQFLP